MKIWPKTFIFFCYACVASSLVLAQPAANDSAEHGTGDASSEPTARAAKFEAVTRWIGDEAPALPDKFKTKAAERFLENLSDHPESADNIENEKNTPLALRSTLLAAIAFAADTPQLSGLREELAKKRIALVGLVKDEAKANALIEDLKKNSPVYFQRLIEGKADDEQLTAYLAKSKESKEAPVALQKKDLSAGEIVSEFARVNQSGVSLEHLYAYKVEATLKTAKGELQSIELYRMRPDRFRLVLKRDGLTELVLASNGKQFWQQLASRPAQEMSRAAMGSRVYLSEFINPLFGLEGYNFSKIENKTGENGLYRIEVLRPDETRYVSVIDKNFREVSHENPDGTRSVTSDFREVGGVTFSFKEEVTDAKGEAGLFTIKRIVINPGLVQTLFEPDFTTEPSFFTIEKLLASAPAPQISSR